MNGVFELLGNFDVQLYVNADQQSGLGELGVVNTTDTSYVLDTNFPLDTATLSGNDFELLNADITSSGRYLKWSVRNAVLDGQFRLQSMEMLLKMIGTRPNV